MRVCLGARETRLLECDCFEFLDDNSGWNEHEREVGGGKYQELGLLIFCLRLLSSLTRLILLPPLYQFQLYLEADANQSLMLSFNFSIHPFWTSKMKHSVSFEGQMNKKLANAISSTLAFGRSLFLMS